MVKKLLFIFLLIPGISISETYSDIVQRLNSEIDPTVRKTLVLDLAQFPSSHALDFLLQVIELEPNADIVSAARTVRREMQRFLFQEDVVILSFHHQNQDFSLRKTLFQEKIKEDPWKRDAQAFSQFYLLDKILDLEIDTYAGKRISESIYSSSRGRALPSRSQLDGHVEKSMGDLLKRYEHPLFQEALMDKLLLGVNASQGVLEYYTISKLKQYIWRRWMEETKAQIKENIYRQTKKEILKYLIEEELRRKGRYRDDFGPQYLRDHISDYHESLKNSYAQFKQNHPDETRTPEEVDQFLKEHSEVKILLRIPKAKLQAVWFTFPSLDVYKEKDPAHAGEAKTLIQGFYRDIFSKEFLGVLEQEALSIFDLDLSVVASDSDRGSKDHIQKLESDLDEQKILLARELKKYSHITQEKLKEALQFYFTMAQEILSQDKTSAYPPAIALVNALEETKGQYLSSGGDFMLAALMWFCGGIMNMKMRDQMFSHLEGRKSQFEKAYHSLISQEMTAEEKVKIFQKVIQEFQSQYPLEFVFVEPDWISRGENFSIPEIEYTSFYGKDRKKPSDQEVYYFWNDPEPSLTVFQWMELEEEHFLEIDELSSDVYGQMMSLLQDQLVLTETLKEAPGVQERLFRKYRGDIGLYPTLDLELYEEELWVPKMGTVNLFLEKH